MKATDDPFQEVTFTVTNCQPMESKTVFAFLDVEIVVGGVAFWIKGVQARHLSGGGTSIHLPTYRTPTGNWRAAIELPIEMVDALSQAVLDHLLETGVAVPRQPSS